MGGDQPESAASDASGEVGDSNGSAGSAPGNEGESAASAQASDEEAPGLSAQDESVQSGEEQPASILGSQNEVNAISGGPSTAASGEYTVEVDETYFFWAASVGNRNKWSSADTSTATVTPYYSYGAVGAYVTGVKPGTTEVIRTFRRWNQDRTETYTIHVKEAPIAKHVTLTGTSVNAVYDGKAHTAGAATVTGNHGHPVVVEYQKADGSWTTNPEEITATTVSSTTINVRASVPGYYEGYVYATEDLTIAKRPVTFTGESDSKPYNEYEQEVTGITAEGQGDGRGLLDGQTWEGLSYSAKGTDPGEYEGTFAGDVVIKAENQDVAANYEVTKTPGKLTITKPAAAGYVTLTGKPVSAVYDGQAHAAGTATATDTNGHAVKIEYQKAGGSWTTNPAEVTATAVADSATVNVRASVPGYYDGYVETTETLEVTQRPVKFTGATDSKGYTGSELEIADITVESQRGDRGLLSGQTYEGLTYSAKGTDPNTYDGAFAGDVVIKANGQDVTANYEVVKEAGTLTVTKSAITGYVTLAGKPVSAVYDGQAHAAGTATATDTNGHAVKIEYQKAGGSWTTNPAEVTATAVADSATVNIRASVSGYYEGYVYAAEALSIDKRPVGFTGESAAKKYTGSEQEITGITAENLVEGQTYEGLTYSAKGTDPDIYGGTFAGDVVIKDNGQDVTENYEVTQTPGKLTITTSDIADNVTLTGTPVSAVYDGQAHAAGTATATDKNGHAVKIEYQVAGGTCTTNPADITATNVADSTTVIVRASVPGYYDGYIETTEALTVTHRPVDFAGASVTKSYTGSEQEITGITAENQHEGRGLLSGQTYEDLTYSAKGTGPGFYDGAFSGDVVIKDDDQDVTANYEVTKTPGKLTIAKSNIDDYVTLSDTLVYSVYDGKPHTADAVNATDKNGHDAVVEYLKSDYTWTTNPADITATNVADSTLVIVRASVPDYYEGYVYTVGILFIDQRPVSFTGESAKKSYNGSEQEITGITAESQCEDSGLLSGQNWEGLSYSARGTVPNTYDGAFTGDVVIKANGQDVTENYEVAQTPGKLAITKIDIADNVTLAGTPASKAYDGKPLAAGTAKATDKYGHGVKVEYQKADGTWTEDPADITATNVADSTTVKVRASVPSYYEGYVETTETLAIYQCPVTLTSESQELTYNGQPQKWEHAGVTSGSFAEGEGVASYSFSNSVTNAGDRVDNAFTYTLNGKTNADNYKIETSYGMIAVKPVADEVIVKVVGHKASATYDGDEHAVSGYDISTESGIYNVGTAVKFSGTAEAAGTDADTYRMGLSADQFENTDGNFSNVTFVVEDGEVAIAPAPYTVVTNSAEKVYDSKSLTAGGKIEGIVKGEDAGFEITGSQTEVGTSDNTYVVKWDKSAKRSNYEFKGESLGTLKVTEAATPAAEGDSSVSDGNSSDVSDKGSSATKAGSTAKTGDAVTPFAAGAGIVALAAALAAFLVSRKRRGTARQ